MTTLSLTEKIDSFEQLIPLLRNKIDSILSESFAAKQLVRVTVHVPSCQPKSWLASQTDSRKLYWANRDESLVVAAVGTTLELKSNSSNTDPSLFAVLSEYLDAADDSIRFYGGGRFSSDHPKESPWDIFGDIYFYLPRFELIKENNSCRFAMNLYPAHDSDSTGDRLSSLEQLSFTGNEPLSSPWYSVSSRSDLPVQSVWKKNIRTALTDISQNRYEKIVLARKTDFTFTNPVYPLALFNQLTDNAPSCYQYYFQPDDGIAFMGATPELLFCRDNGSIKCEAIAGTRRRGDSESEDQQLGDELLQSGKDRNEQAFVSRSIHDALKPYLTVSIESNSGSVELLKLKRVQHLISRFRFNLKKNVSIYDLIKALHPTAAVGGYPKDAVLDRIYELEQFDRGWYASPVGWISKGASEFAVALRCGLVQKNMLSLYSGAGIVSGSQPNEEWAEIENKIAGFMKVIS